MHFVHFNTPKYKISAVELIRARAVEESADIIAANLENTLLVDEFQDMWRHAIEDIPKEGLVLEFGVHKAASLTYFANYLLKSNDLRSIYGFDSFSGLSENWTGTSKSASAFNLDGQLPDVPANAKLVQGWIDDTLPKFLKENQGPISFIHIDTDTFGPASTILKLCKPQLIAGSLILFDELIGYPNWKNHEYKALKESFSDDEYVFKAFGPMQAIIIIK